MSEIIHVIGDGVAGLCAAEALHDAGFRVAVHGDGAAQRGEMTALVHLHAGRSFRTSELEEAAFGRLTEWVGGKKTVVSTTMVRPIVGQTGDRLTSSLSEAVDEVQRIEDTVLGDAFCYGPAFGIDAASTLLALASRLRNDGVQFHSGRVAGRPPRPAVLAVGSDLPDWLEGVDLRLYGGDVATFDMKLDRAFSAGGVHAVPAPNGGACVGSTWWPVDDRSPIEASVRELRQRLGRLGVNPGELQSTWRGTRCVHHTDRRPLVGRLEDGLYVVGALGTRGWFWAPYLAELLVRSLTGGAPHPQLDVERALP
jgi:glycine/D-amino acid oxidase-like deaminating enzyme